MLQGSVQAFSTTDPNEPIILCTGTPGADPELKGLEEYGQYASQRFGWAMIQAVENVQRATGIISAGKGVIQGGKGIVNTYKSLKGGASTGGAPTGGGPPATAPGTQPTSGSLSGGAQDQAAKELEAFKEEFPDAKAGEMLKMQRHGDASFNRGQIGKTGDEAQSMHMAPQSAMRNTPGYNPNNAFTVPGPRDIHTPLDGGWKAVFQNMVNGPNQVTAQQLYNTVSQSINNTQGLTAAEKASLIARLYDELFVEMKLQPGSLVRRPYSPR